MASVAETKMSLAEFESTPGLADNHELVRGELVPTMPSNLVHARIAAWLGSKLTLYAMEHRLGTVFANDPGFHLGPDTLRGPDIAFVAAGRLPQPLEASFGHLAPDLAVEIVSPNDTAFDIEDKVLTYLEAGVRLVWVVYPNRKTVHVSRADKPTEVLSGENVLDGEDVLAGFRLPLRELFGDPPSARSVSG